MLCCLNPDCPNPLNPSENEYCQECNTPLVPLLRGHYRIIKVLSDEGGFGKTYLAEDVDKLGEECVVKQLAPKVQEAASLKKAVELFKDEAKRLQQLGEHNQIPTLLAYFEQDGYLYLVQQYIEGQNLLQELHQEGNYSESKIQELLLDLLPVLQFIHENGVIHRDIKPQNIIRRYSDRRPVLIDFGASKQLSAQVQTKMGTTIGSHGYTPIEQLQNGQAYPASDLFSLGATCFHLLTGVSPSKLWLQFGFSWVAYWRRYLSSPSNGGIIPRLKLGNILDKLLKVDSQKRYQTANEVLQDLTRLPLLTPATLFSKTSPPSRLTSPLLDNRLRNQLIIGGGIVLLGLGGVWYSQLQLPTLLPSSDSSQPTNETSKSAVFPKPLRGHASDVNSVAFTPDSKLLATGSDDKTIKLWNLATRQEIRTLKGHSQWVWTIAISPDGQTLASGSADKTIKLWNIKSGQLIRTLVGHSQGIASVTFSDDGKSLVSGSLDKTIKLWDVATGKKIRTLTGHTQAIASVAMSNDNLTLASGSWDRTIKLWNFSTGREIRTLKGHTDLVLSVAFSPDGLTLASGSKDKTIKLWNLVTGEAIRTLKEHSEKVNSVAFVPTISPGQASSSITLTSGSNDNQILLWNSTTGKKLHTLKRDSGYIYSVAISPDGQMIASGGSADNLVKIWQAPN